MAISFKINNITDNDVRDNLIRILVENKPYFPREEDGQVKSYEIMVKIGSEIQRARYRVEKQRSGSLRIGSDSYKYKLGIKAGDTLKITVLEKNKLYEIEKVSKY